MLDLAEQEGYVVLVTTDQRLPHQQNLSRWRVGVVVLLWTDWAWAIDAVQPGEAAEVPIRPE